MLAHVNQAFNFILCCSVASGRTGWGLEGLQMIQQDSSVVFQWLMVSVSGGEVCSSCYRVMNNLTFCRQLPVISNTRFLS